MLGAIQTNGGYMLIIDNRSGSRPLGDVWQQAGSKLDTSMPATQALARFPQYAPKIETLYRRHNGELIDTGHRGIFMDGYDVPVAVVKGRYTQVTPQDF